MVRGKGRTLLGALAKGSPLQLLSFKSMTGAVHSFNDRAGGGALAFALTRGLSSNS